MPDRPSYPVARLDYDLPPELIAQHALPDRTASRLLHVRVADGAFIDRSFTDLPDLLPPDTLVVLNNSRVIPARLFGIRPVDARGQGGGRVEVLFHRYIGNGISEAVVGSGSRLPEGERVPLPGGWECELLESKRLDGIHVRYLDAAGKVAEAPALLTYLNEHGATPLPPYIKRDPAGSANLSMAVYDKSRYQTVFAASDGSVAAPTAGLHFDSGMLSRLRSAGHRLEQVTLHVGLGTFAPVRVEDLAGHAMHEELYSVEQDAVDGYFKQLAAGKPVMCVGTTSLRVLHTLWQGRNADTAASAPLAGGTRAFIYPGQGTEACDLLLTNYHLPRSTLLALVYAFGGEDLMRRVYEHAIAERYRFFSYGDCMLIDRRE